MGRTGMSFAGLTRIVISRNVLAVGELENISKEPIN